MSSDVGIRQNAFSIPSKYHHKAFVKAAQIYQYLRKTRDPSSPNSSPLSYDDLMKPTQELVLIKRQAIELLINTLCYERFYQQVLKNQIILPLRQHENYLLAMLVLHDMKDRMMFIGISGDGRDTNMAALERHFCNSRVLVWSEMTKVEKAHGANDLQDFRDLRYEKFLESRNFRVPLCGWINVKREKNPALLVEKLIKSGINVRRCHYAKLDLPNVIRVETSQLGQLLKQPACKNYLLVIRDAIGCVGPHCFVNSLVQKMRILNSCPIPSKTESDSVDIPEERDHTIFDNFDVAVSCAGNGLDAGHIAILLQAVGFTGHILAFDCGGPSDKARSQRIIKRLKAHKVRFFYEDLSEVSVSDPRLAKVMAVYVNPKPCSWSINNLMQHLSTEDSDYRVLADIYNDRMDSSEFLEKQKEMLKHCMSLPKVQVVVYAANMSDDKKINENIVSSAVRELRKPPIIREDSTTTITGEVISREKLSAESESLFDVGQIPYNIDGYQRLLPADVKEQSCEGDNGFYVVAIIRKDLSKSTGESLQVASDENVENTDDCLTATDNCNSCSDVSSAENINGNGGDGSSQCLSQETLLKSPSCSAFCQNEDFLDDMKLQSPTEQLGDTSGMCGFQLKGIAITPKKRDLRRRVSFQVAGSSLNSLHPSYSVGPLSHSARPSYSAGPTTYSALPQEFSSYDDEMRNLERLKEALPKLQRCIPTTPKRTEMRAEIHKSRRPLRETYNYCREIHFKGPVGSSSAPCLTAKSLRSKNK